MSAEAAIVGGHLHIVADRGQWHPWKGSIGWCCNIWHPWKGSISGDGGFGGVRKKFVELHQSFAGVCIWRRKQGIALRLAESRSEIFRSCKEDVGGTGGGHCEVVWEPVDSVGDTNGVGSGDPDLVAAIVMEARADVVTSSSVY